MKYETELDLSFNNTMTLFIDQIKEKTTVLEFGPASGRLTRYLKNEKGCSVYIVEIDKEAGMIAAKDATDYVIGDILEYEWVSKFAGVEFDYILFADVLEHLTDAKDVLKKCREFLKDDGKICFSVPNIAHNSVIINLLNNRFKYTSTGIMDNTHVHFYTRENADNLVKDAGLFVEKRYATYTQVGKNEFDNSYEDVNPELSHLLKTRPFGEVYQYVYVISKNENAVAEDFINRYADYDYAQLFLDYDGDYSEVKKDYLRSDETERTFVLENVSKARKLRFDPSLNCCIMRLIEASAYISGQKSLLKVESHNAEFVIGDYYYFNSEDPQIHFLLDDNTDYERIEIVAEYAKVTDENSIDEAEKRLSESYKDSMDSVRRLNDEVKELRDKLNEEKDENTFLREFASQRFIGRIFTRFCKKKGKYLR